MAVRFLELVETGERAGVLQVAAITPAVFRAAIALFRQYDTVVLSLTDCTNFAICEQYRIAEASAFDQHFSMRGIVLCVL
ncbi:MAG: hypothetical protein HYW07_24465 [Candidatus Latescibacteria bacterium]|nr:hypothetical protein [Candidatus Latescibacterota bacterium]